MSEIDIVNQRIAIAQRELIMCNYISRKVLLKETIKHLEQKRISLTKQKCSK